MRMLVSLLRLWWNNPFFAPKRKTGFYIFVFPCLSHCCAFCALPGWVCLSGEDINFLALVAEPFLDWARFGYKKDVRAGMDCLVNFCPSAEENVAIC